MSETARLIDTIKWKSIDKDNMEFEARVTCYQRDAILSQTERVKALTDKLDRMESLLYRADALATCVFKAESKADNERNRHNAAVLSNDIRRQINDGIHRAALQGTGT